MCGYVLHRQPAALPALMRRVPGAALLAAVLFPLSMAASRLDHSALRFFDRASAWSLYVSQSSYWVFLIHMPLVLLAGWWLVQFDLPAMVKFLLVCSFAAAGGFLSFHYAVQNSWLSDLQHGRRFDLPWPWQARARSFQA